MISIIQQVQFRLITNLNLVKTVLMILVQPARLVVAVTSTLEEKTASMEKICIYKAHRGTAGTHPERQ